MMNILVGDKETLAIECYFDSSSSEGRVFIFVNNVRFGQDDFDENVFDFFERVTMLESLEFVESEELFFIDKKSFLIAIEEFWQSGGGMNSNSLKTDLAIIDSENILRMGYAFDRHLIALIPFLDHEKLIVFSDDDELGSEVIVKKGVFFTLVRNLVFQLNESKKETKGG